ncbi:hypothetical protein [Blastopirellula marina]|uniref:Uncharacterized protein n=1 Tax=Blastopirellula marina TaxID=124 RepID=A0A2S8GET1_9BACT|nr:hypothetical protein [Blastopirellula marina]PQO42923.1 hypothetical protein C5Y93_24680 [Blastopirellula marina]
MQITERLNSPLLFGYFQPKFDYRLMVTNLGGQELPHEAIVRAAGVESERMKLSTDTKISIGASDPIDAETSLIRGLAFGFYPMLVESRGIELEDGFEGILECEGERTLVSRKSLVVEVLPSSLFYLPRFQDSLLQAAQESFNGQPFSEPLDRRLLGIANSISLRSGDYLVIDVGGQPGCLALKSEATKDQFRAELFVASEHLRVNRGDILISSVKSRIGGIEASFSAAICRVLDISP